MGLAVITVAAGGLPVKDLGGPGGIAVTEVAPALGGIAVTKVAGAVGGMGVTFVSATGGPVQQFTTTWNVADKTANMGLSNGNLTATPSGANGAVRATVGRSSGKYYFEYTSVATNQLNDFFGLVDAAIALPSGSAVKTTVGTVGINGTTNFYANGVDTEGVSNIGSSAPPFIYIAVDLDASLIWIKVPGIAGSGWNTGGTANPATGVGGYATGLAGKSLKPYCGFITTSTQLTANFGASAFVGAVPSGFTAGWPA